MKKSNHLFSTEEQLLMKEIAIECNVEYAIIEKAVAHFWDSMRRSIGAAKFVMLPISTGYKDENDRLNFVVSDEIIDITKFVRVKPFINKRTKEVMGSLLCYEPSAMHGTINVHKVTITEIAELYKKAGVPITVVEKK